MYAVIKTGGKQYRVAADDVIEVEKLVDKAAGDAVSFTDVMMIGGNGDASVGTPYLDGASVSGEVVEQKRGRKVTVFKKKRRQNYRRKKGHRQHLTAVKIVEILAKGAKPKAKAAAKPATEKAAAETPAPAAAGAFELLTAPRGQSDNISLLSGVGPALEEKLHTYGIYHFWQIAAMSADDIAKMDEELKLGGRVEREEWVDQAKELMAGKAPRAKVDQKAAGKAEAADKDAE